MVEVAGVGYRAAVSPSTLVRLGEPGGAVRLFTHLHVREDALTLYGFVSGHERDSFERLIGPHGVGPALALAILSVHSPGELRDAVADGDLDALTLVPGVGRKTAACVLLFAYGMRDVPVDTHVSRVGTRLGLFRPGAGFEELHDDFLEMVKPGEGLEFHVNLLRHGRRTCHAQRPACHACALRRACPKVGVVV